MNYKKELEKALASFSGDPDEADLLVDEIEFLTRQDLTNNLKEMGSKLQPFKADSKDYIQNGRDRDDGSSYWYEIQYPEEVWLRYKSVFNQVKRWERISSVPSLRKYLKRGTSLPPLEGAALEAYDEMVKDLIQDGSVLPHVGRVGEGVSDHIETEITQWFADKNLYEEQISQRDRNGDPVMEAGSTEIIWDMTYAESLDAKIEKKGHGVLTGFFSVKVKVRISKVLVPGDRDWGRRWGSVRSLVSAYLKAAGVSVKNIEPASPVARVERVSSTFERMDEWHITGLVIHLVMKTPKPASEKEVETWARNNWRQIRLMAPSKTPPAYERQWDDGYDAPAQGLGWLVPNRIEWSDVESFKFEQNKNRGVIRVTASVRDD